MAMRALNTQLNEAVRVLRAMGARRVVLFGSAAEQPVTARDLDLAVEGIPLTRLLDADLALQQALDQPADLVSREDNPGLFDLACRFGRVLYEQG
jgi:predicted nucleotidyltransferase